MYMYGQLRTRSLKYLFMLRSFNCPVLLESIAWVVAVSTSKPLAPPQPHIKSKSNREGIGMSRTLAFRPSGVSRGGAQGA